MGGIAPLQQEASSIAKITAAFIPTIGGLSKMQIWTQSISGPLWSQDRNASLWLGDTPPFSLHSLFLAPHLDLGEAPEPQILAGLGQGEAKMRTDNHSF